MGRLTSFKLFRLVWYSRTLLVGCGLAGFVCGVGGWRVLLCRVQSVLVRFVEFEGVLYGLCGMVVCF